MVLLTGTEVIVAVVIAMVTNVVDTGVLVEVGGVAFRVVVVVRTVVPAVGTVVCSNPS